MTTTFQRALGVALPFFLAALSACGNDFAPASKIEGVRILAARADKPYAKPGDTVNVDLLAFDGRRDTSRPMRLQWISAPCFDPPGGLAEACYPAFEGMFARGVDLTPQLLAGPSRSFTVPSDLLARSVASQSGTPFANVFTFAFACAGHVEYVGARGPSPRAVPFACFDDGGHELGAEDFVFASSRVFVFADRANANPIVSAITLDGQVVDPASGVTLDRCATPSKVGAEPTCPTHALDVVVPEGSHELDPSNADVSGAALREAVWVDYYLTDGRVKSDVRVLFDARAGRVPSENDLEAPSESGDATLWAVAHDNRGGVGWASVPIHVR